MQPCQPPQSESGLPDARMQRILQQWLCHLMPARCVLCRQPAGRHISLCRECESSLKTNPTNCESCARPLQKSGLCGECQKNPPYYDKTLAPLLYKDAVRNLLIELKFHEKLLNAKILAEVFTRLTNNDCHPDLMIPVPLHSGRLRERGYNQSLEIAREITAIHKIPFARKGCERRINTARQSELPMQQRKANVRGAFQSCRRFDNLHIAIIDDVMTTGNTVNELSKVLKKSGARRVDVWVIARA